MSAKPISGTREWSVASVNCVAGCEHNCRYCYAREQALRFKRIATPEQWAIPVVREKEVNKRRHKVDGRVMFPMTSDITPDTFAACDRVLQNLLVAGNDVLIVTKPHFTCIELLCGRLMPWRDQVMFRFTIGAMNDKILRYWEPFAPAFQERLDSLFHAYTSGYATSVSCEPCLDTADVEYLFWNCEPYITDSFWIGKANKLAKRCTPDTSPIEIARIEAGQTNDQIFRVYEALKGEPKIRWKESYKAVLGLRGVTFPGEDL